jgi:hypothetical protein
MANELTNNHLVQFYPGSGGSGLVWRRPGLPQVDWPSPHPTRPSRGAFMTLTLAGVAIVRRIASLTTCGACWGSMCPP